MKTTSEHAYRDAEALLAPFSRVAVLMPLSRTWYQDQSALYELLLLLAAYDADVAIIGNSGVRHCAALAAELADTCPLLLDGATAEAELFLESAVLCVALPARHSKEITSASPLVDLALLKGIPVLALWPTREATYVTLRG